MKPLLNHLRIRLVLLYLAVGIVLALGISAGTFTLVNYYFRTSNDEALRIKMGIEFATFHLPLPIDLYHSLVQAGLVDQGQDPHLLTNPNGNGGSNNQDPNAGPQQGDESIIPLNFLK